MSNRFDDLAMSWADAGAVGRRSMIRGALAAVGLGAGAALTGARPAAAAPSDKPVRCPAGLTSCGGLCRDLTSNVEHCGACGNVCGLDSVCRNGTCVKVACTCEPTCASGLTWCGACVNTATDEANCGACGTACAPGQVCSNGTCIAGTACTTPADCPGSDDDCQSRTCTNGVCGVLHSGDGATCAGGNGTCVDGICTSTCPGADLMTDPNNCGSCGNVCPSINSTPICTNGTCGHGTCNAGYGDCDPTRPGCETDLMNDVGNCGGCGIVCDAGETCTSGTCTTTCVPQTCTSMGKNCGTHSDGCGGLVNCGSCTSGTVCSPDGVCV